MSWIPPSLRTSRLFLTVPPDGNRLQFSMEGPTVLEQDLPGLPSNWTIYLKDSDESIGSIGFIRWEREDRLGEIGFILMHTHRNQGYMTEACQTVIDFGFECLALKTIEARSRPVNLSSIRVLKKVGMKKEGRVKARLSSKGDLIDLDLYRVHKTRICMA